MRITGAVFFDLPTVGLFVLIFGLVLGSTALGAFAGRRVRHLSDALTEPFGVLQAAMLGVVGLILAFGLSLALSRYEDRRTSIVEEANAIGTTYLRAQTLDEPVRRRSLALLVEYAEAAIQFADHVPGGEDALAAEEEEQRLHREIWALADRALDEAPQASAPRLYVESLNELIDAQTVRSAALNNRVPAEILWLELIGSCFALALLAAYLSLVGRGLVGVLVAALVIAGLLFVTADLDRPTRGPIQVPDTVLVDQLESMRNPPAAGERP
jgi:hypothetical protein